MTERPPSKPTKNPSGVAPDDRTNGRGSTALSSLLDQVDPLDQTTLYPDNRVELLIDGPATYEKMFDDIDQARHCILMESFIFAADEVGERFADALARKSREGVVVKLCYDSIGSLDADRSFFTPMEEAGVEVIEFNRLDAVDEAYPLSLNHRNHRKLLVIDGHVAYTGGINVSGTYAKASGEGSDAAPLETGWRDTHVRVRGPAVAGFRERFEDQWRKTEGRTLDGLDRSPPADVGGSETVAILTADGDSEGKSPIASAYQDAIGAARERVWLTQAYFVPGRPLMKLIKEAAARGVDVRILVPGFSDSRLVLAASRSRYGKLLRAGVRIYETKDAFIHAKTAVIDGVWSTVGSSNLDFRSFLHNDEINAVILGEDFAAEMERQFEEDTRPLPEITIKDWKSRSLTSRFIGVIAWIVERWI